MTKLCAAGFFPKRGVRNHVRWLSGRPTVPFTADLITDYRSAITNYGTSRRYLSFISVYRLFLFTFTRNS